jgi:hypothetical protein
MPGVIDSHIHLYPPEVCRDPSGWAEAQGEPGWSRCVAPTDRRSIQGWADIDRLLSDMDRAGVERCVLLGWYWERQVTCDLQNEWYGACVKLHPDRLSAFAAAQPGSGTRAVEGARKALDSGLAGLGELHPTAQGFSFSDEGWHGLAELAGQRGVPITLHVSDPAASVPGAVPTPLDSYVRTAGEFPSTRLILAHWGGGLPFLELNPKVAAALRNVFYDSAASPLLYSPSVYRRVADLVGPERILFGSDYPLLSHPRETREPGFERSIRDARGSGLTEAELERVMGGNLRRLLSLR